MTDNRSKHEVWQSHRFAACWQMKATGAKRVKIPPTEDLCGFLMAENDTLMDYYVPRDVKFPSIYDFPASDHFGARGRA
jgi:hypothetical protein